MPQQGDPGELRAELREVRSALDETAARRRGALDRTAALSLGLMLVGLAVFASVSAYSYAAGQPGRGRAFAVLAVIALPFVLYAAWSSVGRYLVLGRSATRIRQRESEITTRIKALDATPDPHPTPAPPPGRTRVETPATAEPAPVPAAAAEPARVAPAAITADVEPTEAAAMIEAALPAYAVQRMLGKGGCGIVFLAEHRQAGWQRALKLLTEPDLLPDSQSRFLREAQVMESLDHPHVARVYEYVEHAGFNLIVMEFLARGSASARRTELLGRPEPLCALGLAVADALAAAHARGVVHRDIKPGNLLFAEDGTVKVTDFGIAKLLAGGVDGEQASVLALTPGYAAPEQINGDEITARTDLFGLSATLYKLFTGRTPPLPGPDGSPRANLTAIPPGIASVLERSLNGFPENRHPTAKDFALDLAAASGAALRPGWLDAAEIPFRGAPEIRAAATV
ncbi:serine/threonine-protein kinase [Cryptosporangium sp. NPDC048952]|uniref:serine/threonine-protein kinase n=1 Tax=Cryptosporangium sp. NPDC048952 TaxID=3363961 RepID=UPI0037247CA3